MLIIYTDQPHLQDHSFPGSPILTITVLKYWQKVKIQITKLWEFSVCFPLNSQLSNEKRKSFYLLSQIASALGQPSGCF